MALRLTLMTAVGTAGGNPVVIDTNSLPGAQVGVFYTATLIAQGGIPPYVWSIVSGSLPAGLSLSSNGVISGTPTGTAGLSTFTVMALDGPKMNSATADGVL